MSYKKLPYGVVARQATKNIHLKILKTKELCYKL